VSSADEPAGLEQADDDLYVANEYVDFQGVPSDTPLKEAAVAVQPAADAGQGLRLDDQSVPSQPPARAQAAFAPDACREAETLAWRDEVARTLAASGARRQVDAAQIKLDRATSLVQLSQALNLEAAAAVSALGQSIDNQTRVRMAINYERESVYQVINATFLSTEQDALARPQLAAAGIRAKIADFYDHCGDAFIAQRTLGARYVQYYLTTRSSIQNSFSFANKTTVKLKLGPFRAQSSINLGWEFSRSAQAHFLDQWRYVAAPTIPAKFPTTPACMALFADTLHAALTAAPPGQGAPVALGVLAYPGNVQGMEDAAGQKLVDAGPQALGLLQLVDDVAKYLGAVRDVLANPGDYKAPDRPDLLRAKFQLLSGSDFSPDVALSATQPGGLVQEIIKGGRVLLDDYAKGRVLAGLYSTRLAAWRQAIDPTLLPRRFRYPYIVNAELTNRDAALAFCKDLRDQTFNTPTLKMMKDMYPAGVWRLPTSGEARAMRHALPDLLAALSPRRIHVGLAPDAPATAANVMGEQADGSADQRLPAAGDVGNAAVVCIFGPVAPAP
jgi:hypothetical protein